MMVLRWHTHLSLVHLNSNATVCVAGADNDAGPLHRSKVEADLQLRIYHKLLRCKQVTVFQQLNQLVIPHNIIVITASKHVTTGLRLYQTHTQQLEDVLYLC